MSIPTSQVRSIRLSNSHQVSLGRRLGLGEQLLVHRDRSRSYAVWVFSADEVATIEREYAALRGCESFRPPRGAEAKAAVYAAQLEREGWEPEAARARAREAYGLQAATRAQEPRISREWMREYRDEVAGSRPGGNQ
jgi:hypothetical protein